MQYVHEMVGVLSIWLSSWIFWVAVLSALPACWLLSILYARTMFKPDIILPVITGRHAIIWSAITTALVYFAATWSITKQLLSAEIMGIITLVIVLIPGLFVLAIDQE